MDTIATASLTPGHWLAYDTDTLIIGRGPTEAAAIADFIAAPMPDVAQLLAALDAAHDALRAVDASDTTVPQTDRSLDLVSDACILIERTAREIKHLLPENRRLLPSATP